MPPIDKIKEELAVLREEYKNLFILFLAIITGTVTTFYQVITGKIGINILLLSSIGLMASIFVLILIKKVREKIDQDLKDLGDL